MNTVTKVTPAVSRVSRGAILKQLFVIAYVTTVAVATIGWVSAFGWLTVKVAKLLLA